MLWSFVSPRWIVIARWAEKSLRVPIGEHENKRQIAESDGKCSVCFHGKI